MAEVPGSSGRFAPRELGVALDPSTLRAPAIPLPSANPVHDKTVRFGTHEPALLSLTRRGVLPFVVVLVLTNCVLIAGETLSVQFLALALIALLVSALILSPPLGYERDSAAAYVSRPASRMLLEWFCVAVVMLFVTMAFALTQPRPRVILVWLLVTPLALLLTDSLSAQLARRLAGGWSVAERYVIIGANEVGIELARRIKQSQSGGKFFGFLDFRSANRLPDGADKPVAANCSARDLADYVRQHSITRVYLALPISTTPRVDELIKELRDTTASVYFVPNIFAFDLMQARCVDISGMPVLSICDSPFHGTSAIWKRTFDITLATILLALGWPVFVIIGLAIKLTSPGPVLFKQRRYGLNGEEILVYKFRTMTVCEDGPVVTQAVERDWRVTPLGGYLRRMSLDELPQIFNVLEGKMSFVGPRPHAVSHNEEYRKLISGYMVRHKVRPGITGWAQVNGFRGETRTVERMQGRVHYDLEYLKNWSLGLDIKIVLKTALIVLKDKNAY